MSDEMNTQVESVKEVKTGAEASELSAATADVRAASVDAIQEDIKKIQYAIGTLESAGADLFSDEISALRQKLSTAQAELEQLATAAETTVQEVEDVLLSVKKSFAEKYGQGIAHGVEIFLLVTIAGKLLGVI